MFVLDVPAYNQRELGYPTGCETVSLGMLINYSASVNIHTLFSKLPLAFDPELGFRGDPTADTGFTVFPKALLKLAGEYLDAPCDISGCENDDLKSRLENGTPVVVWVSGLGFNVHAICLSGFDETGFFYNDPWTGEKDAHIPFAEFGEIWNKPIYDEELRVSYEPRKALSYNANHRRPVAR